MNEPSTPTPAKSGRRRWNMLIPTLIMAVLAVTLLLVGVFRGRGEHLEGLKATGTMSLQILPMLFFAFLLAGMMQVLLPRDQIARWVGSESGPWGILLGAFAGALMPGGPYVNLPVALGLMRAGASVGCVVAFLTGWSLWAVNRLPMEFGILGWKLTAARFASTLVFPPLAGFIAESLFGRMTLPPAGP